MTSFNIEKTSRVFRYEDGTCRQLYQYEAKALDIFYGPLANLIRSINPILSFALGKAVTEEDHNMVAEIVEKIHLNYIIVIAFLIGIIDDSGKLAREIANFSPNPEPKIVSEDPD